MAKVSSRSAVPKERRSGGDRRRAEAGLPKGVERRRAIEPRGPQVHELALTPEEWQRLYGGSGQEP